MREQEGSFAVADAALRNLIPVLFAIGFILVAMLPYRIPVLGPVFPALTLVVVYFWSIYRPELLPAAAVFLVGFFQDVLSGAPLGLSSFVLLLVHWIVVHQRRVFIGKAFWISWAGFGLVAIGAAFGSWAIASIYHGTLVAAGAVFTQLLLTIAIYPGISWVFSAAEKIIPHHE
jgi:rod shape-determining protein MreD